jgi:hypothetical protein
LIQENSNSDPERMMQPKRLTPIDDASAWTSADMAADMSWIYTFDKRGIAAIDAALIGVRDIPYHLITQADFPLADLQADITNLAAAVAWGRGFVLMRGFPSAKYTHDEAAKAYWGLGTHFGIAVTQTGKGVVLGDIRDEGVVFGGRKRGYNSANRLPYHCDDADIVGLLCLNKAKQGGLSNIASTAAIYNEILRTRPDLLDVYYDGFYYDLRGEQRPGAGEISTHPIPVYSYHDGYLSSRYVRGRIGPAASLRGVGLTDREIEALDLFDKLADCDEFRLDMQFEPGDIQLLNNHVTVHSRSDFEDHDDPSRKRHLLRLWLRTHLERPLSLNFAERYGPGTARMGVPVFT